LGEALVALDPGARRAGLRLWVREGNMIGSVVLLVLAAISARGLYTGFTPEIKYGQLAWGALGAWSTLVLLWLRVPRRVRKSEQGATVFVSYAVTLLLCVAPGVILACYGWLAAAVPSYTRGGVDVCELEVGYCVSGTRSFIFFGFWGVVIGLIINWVINLKTPPKSES
jgi:FtsH-binding integral membrane protein